MVTPSEHESWVKAFEQYGPNTLRFYISNPAQSGMSGEYKRAAERWIAEQDAAAEKRDQKRFEIVRRWTIAAAAVAGFIAAVASVIAIWPTPH
jgi:hypothetical protein